MQNEAARKTRLDSVEQLQKLEVIEQVVNNGSIDSNIQTLYGKCCAEKKEG